MAQSTRYLILYILSPILSDMRNLTSELKAKTGKKIKLAGWLHKKRLLGGINFILLRDRAGVAQVKVERDSEVEKLRNLQIGTVLEVEGTVASDERAPGGVEIHQPTLGVLAPVTDTPPIEIDKPISHKSEHLDTLFEHRVINLRNLTEQNIFKVSAGVVQAAENFFRDNGFIQVFTPKLLAAATEGGAEVFKLDHFGAEATLAQSPQFYKQILVGAFERVFEIAPVYRAEPSATTRHMSEYISIDMEMGFITGLDDLLDILSQGFNHVCDSVWSARNSELASLQAVKPKLTKQLPSITLAELHQKYSQDTGKDTTREPDPTPAEERWVSQWAEREHGSEAVFVTEFPAREMKFYHMQSESNPEVALRADLIFRGVEIMTTSQREHRYERLVKQLKAARGNPDNPGFKPLLDAMKYGMPPHGGVGWGLERTVERIIGLDNVKEASLFPRDMNRLTP